MFETLIYNNKPYDNFKINKNGEIRNRKTNHIYKKYISSARYYVVTLPMGARGKAKGIRVHKALAETFIPNTNNYKIVHHKDENKLNIDLENLEWTTSQQNTEYHIRHMLKIIPFVNNRKLTNDDVIKIYNDDTTSYKKLAEQFNVSKTTIINIKKGLFYREVTNNNNTTEP